LTGVAGKIASATALNQMPKSIKNWVTILNIYLKGLDHEGEEEEEATEIQRQEQEGMGET